MQGVVLGDDLHAPRRRVADDLAAGGWDDGRLAHAWLIPDARRRPKGVRRAREIPMTVDPRAATGFASAVDAYERGRPSYPREAVARLVRELGLTRDSTVLDLAAGTGKLTEGLVTHVG